MLSISTDAHTPAMLGNMRYGIGMALEDFGRWLLGVVSNPETFALVKQKFDETSTRIRLSTTY